MRPAASGPFIVTLRQAPCGVAAAAEAASFGEDARIEDRVRRRGAWPAPFVRRLRLEAGRAKGAGAHAVVKAVMELRGGRGQCAARSCQKHRHQCRYEASA